jgi:hypothetical protein
MKSKKKEAMLVNKMKKKDKPGTAASTIKDRIATVTILYDECPFFLFILSRASSSRRKHGEL